MIPDGIEIEHLDSAIREILENGIPNSRKSVHYDYLHGNERYPPKYVISLATKYAFGNELQPSEFDAVTARDYLRARGHTVVDRREGADSEANSARTYISDSNINNSIERLKSGTILNNERLCEFFSCSTQGGMRRSLKTNTLVIVSNHIKSIYDDRWINDVFHYTGMGMKGDQSLSFAQNKTLAESNLNGVDIHLFEVFVDKQYQYMGKVHLSDSPYFESQPDANGAIRKVCIFPLRLNDGSIPTISSEDAQRAYEEKAKKAKKLSDEEVKRRAKNSNKSVGSRQTTSQQYDRNPWVAENAKREAKGICQLCEEPAPFSSKSNEAYLETHHIVWLAKNGEDSIENTVALCPNCHRRMHVLNNDKDILFLQAKKRS